MWFKADGECSSTSSDHPRVFGGSLGEHGDRVCQATSFWSVEGSYRTSLAPRNFTVSRPRSSGPAAMPTRCRWLQIPNEATLPVVNLLPRRQHREVLATSDSWWQLQSMPRAGVNKKAGLEAQHYGQRQSWTTTKRRAVPASAGHPFTYLSGEYQGSHLSRTRRVLE